MNQISFFKLVKMLRDTESWEQNKNSIYEDSFIHSPTKVHFYSNEGVTFRLDDCIFYDTNVFTWLGLMPFVYRLRKAIKRRNNENN